MVLSATEPQLWGRYVPVPLDFLVKFNAELQANRAFFKKRRGETLRTKINPLSQALHVNSGPGFKMILLAVLSRGKTGIARSWTLLQIYPILK